MAICSSCNSEVVPGARWCSICRANVVRSDVGRLAPPGRRLGAYVLDVAVPIVALVMMLSVAGAGGATGTDAGAGIGGLFAALMLLAYVVWAFVLFSRGTTPGKKLLGMRVVREDGSSAGFFTMLIREWIGKAISSLVFSLGFLWILFDRDNQGWHDKLVSTYVVR